MSASTTVEPHIAYELIDETHPDVVAIEFLNDEIVGPADAREFRGTASISGKPGVAAAVRSRLRQHRNAGQHGIWRDCLVCPKSGPFVRLQHAREHPGWRKPDWSGRVRLSLPRAEGWHQPRQASGFAE